MIRVSVYKEIFESYSSRPFNVRISKLQELKNGVYKADATKSIIYGSYVPTEKQCIAWELENVREKVIKALNKDCKMIIFTHTFTGNKNNDISDEEKRLMEVYMSMHENQQKEQKTKESSEVTIEDFKDAVSLLQDKEKFINLIPFEFECVAVAVLKDTDEDKIVKERLNNEPVEIEAPNGNIFNIHIIDYKNI